MRLASTTVGDGARTALLVHGINATGELWHDFATLLAERHGFTVHAVDLRGHGASPRAASYLLADFAADLIGSSPLVPDLAVGHSLGGRILAEAVAAIRPARAVYLDPAFALAGGAAGATALRLTPGLGPAVGWLFSRGTPGLSAENRERFDRSTERWDRRMIRPLVVDVASRPVAIAPPVVPSTIVRAPRSLLLSRRRGRRLARAGWDVRTLPGAVHDMATLDPEGTLAAIRDVLG